jgi:hypothetical protein
MSKGIVLCRFIIIRILGYGFNPRTQAVASLVRNGRQVDEVDERRDKTDPAGELPKRVSPFPCSRCVTFRSLRVQIFAAVIVAHVTLRHEAVWPNSCDASVSG